jgi:hypothetical protein
VVSAVVSELGNEFEVALERALKGESAAVAAD